MVLSGDGTAPLSGKTQDQQGVAAAVPDKLQGTTEGDQRLQREREDKGINPFTRGGAVQRSPPTKSISQMTDTTDRTQGDPIGSHYDLDSAKTVWLPTTHERRGSLGSVESLLTAHKTRPTGKRMRNEEEEREEAQAEIMNAIARLTKITAGLVKIVGENASTNMEIKNGVRDLKGYIDYLNKMTKDWENSPRKASKTRAISKLTKVVGTQTDKDDSENRNDGEKRNNIKETGTQTEDSENKTQPITNLKEKIQECNSLERLVEIIDLEWPADSINRVKTEKGSLSTIDKDWDIMVVAKPGRKEGDKPKGIRKMLKNTYPEALELLEKSETSSVEYTVRTSKSSKKGIADRERWVYVAPCIEEPKGPKPVEILYNQIQGLREILKEHGRKKKLAIVAEKGVNKEHLHKILETVLASTGLEIKLVVEGKETRKVGRQNEKRTETLLIKGKGSYADTLKKMKTNVTTADMKQLGVEVKSVKKTDDGKVLMKVTGDAEALRNKLSNVLECTEVGLGKEVIFHITGMEEDVSAEDLQTAVESELKIPVQVKSIRPTQYGSKTGTIAMSPQSAKSLANVTSLIVGWTRCRIRKRVHVEKCYRCWETGHKATKCKGPNRANLCRRCGDEGHKAENCSAKPFCPLCQESGHRAATTGCPKFRKAINDADQPRQGGRARTAPTEPVNGD